MWFNIQQSNKRTRALDSLVKETEVKREGFPLIVPLYAYLLEDHMVVIVI